MSHWYRFFGLALGFGASAALLAFGCSDDETDDDGGPSGPASTTTTGPGGNGGSGGSAGGGGGNGGNTMLGLNCDPPDGAAGTLTLTEVASNLGDTIEAVAPWGDDERLFIIEQVGRIQLLKNGTVSQFLDITARVTAGGERGLLGLAFHPDYVQNGRFFVHYSGPGGDTVIEEYARSADPDVANPDPVGSPILTVTQPAGNHNGGTIAFNPQDGFLYIGLGDGGASCDLYGNAQDTDTPLGALLRIDIDTTPYSIPPGNLQGAGAPEIYDYGLRNPYRWTFDGCTGDRYIADVGQNAFEEVNVAASSEGNKNWGWPIFEGATCPAPGCTPIDCNAPGLSGPVVDYPHTGQSHSVVGGYVYRGSAIPWLRGTYFYAEFYTGQVWTFRWEGGMAVEQTEVTQQIGPGDAISAFGQDNRGELYIVTYGGTVYRIDPG